MSTNEFKPAWWLRNSHLQTIWPAVWRTRHFKDLPLTRERLELPDGDFIDLDWAEGDKQLPLVLILHGLEGSINSHYARGMLCALQQKGMRGVFMHFRGCSGEPNRLPRRYHSGDTKDVSYVTHLLLQREPGLKMAAVGFSLGGNVLLKWMGETGEKNPLSAAVAISVPFELHKAASHICKGFSRFYQWYFIRCLRENFFIKYHDSDILDTNILNQVHTMYDFDDKITAPLHGFRGVEDYYSSASSRRYLKTINVPTLILHAKDDPFMSKDVIPNKEELSPSTKLEISEGGGHVGFIGGKLPWRPEYWLEKRTSEFLAGCLKTMISE